jgi:TPP-dependent pyruvate/acetoin dehydrogenase alpha subunit
MMAPVLQKPGAHMTTQETTPAALLESMMLVRAFEEQNSALAAAGHAPGTCTSVGQEAAAVGVIKALAPHDLILTNHRSAGHLLARGADPGRVLAEIMGRSTGYCKGKSGSLHISAKELGVILTSTIVGGELSMATGVGMSVAMQPGDAVVACIFGDGAACEGIFHESLNLAAVWNLPILYVCENNQWQAFVHRKETMLTERIATRASAYGMDGITVDGNDVEAVYAATREAVAGVRRERRPILLETCTYRTRGHYEPDDQAYVDPAELSNWKSRDPIEALKSKALASGQLTGGDLRAIEARVREALERALAFAKDSPFPQASELHTDVYA